jgi:hypothetical protein
LIGVSRVGKQATIRAIGMQIQLLQYSLADEHFIPENQGFFHGIAAHDIEENRESDSDALLAAVSILCDALPANR